ncbi:transcription factor HES-7.1-B [Xenopus laevis]|uniref:Transcription factor HES-7.1-B n=1 Tax=Xenopus laevis TaxID=8355 RepID=HE71B_XENLA|nr:transcription factor HES-7.1-B [Xenopus laevis]Q8UW72.1 RecName: Full=Transcription factor HES-7.1-B; AltName: Full=HES-related protein 1-B; Short=XHR1-B; AltName: Full=Hairy and enhancer of split 7.1-B [Xenopus laevis]BAB78542.1 HES-related 1B [Xenopus laevis]
MKGTSEVKPMETHRKLLKPLVEKRRRERINNSLEKLRIFLSQTLKSEKLKNPKVEKAEILECTVQFLQSRKLLPLDREAVDKEYQSGFQHCLETTLHFMNSKPDMNGVTKELLSHQMSSCKPPSDAWSPTCAPLTKHVPSLSYQDSTPHLVSNSISISPTKTLVDSHFTYQTFKTWRPWV